MRLEQKITQAWYRDGFWVKALLPLAKIYQVGLNRRRRKALSKNRTLAIPVVVIGNITVGGTGKTPLVIHLCQKLKAMGISVGVVSRGYGSRHNQYPYEVNDTDSALQAADEPLLICQQSGAAVVIDPDRFAAARHLSEIKQVDVILSDDGLQHFGLPRAMEIVVVDGSRELGNELLLPAGPLREPVKKLRDVDFCLVNGAGSLKSEALKCAVNGYFELKPCAWVQVATGKRLGLEEFVVDEHVKAVAAIGNPWRFFNTLGDLGIQADTLLPLNDHQLINSEVLQSLGSDNLNTQILMTMKDAVKCRDFATDNCWALDVGLEINSGLEKEILDRIQALGANRASIFSKGQSGQP